MRIERRWPVRSHGGRMLACALVLAALVAGSGRAGAAPCAEGEPEVGDLGIRGLSCDCTISSHSHSGDGRTPEYSRRWRFRSEPRITRLAASRPRGDRLEEGDAIVAVDGALITTVEGGRRFADIAPGVPVTLRVRREGRLLDLRITPGAICWSRALGNEAPAAPAPPAPPPAPAPPAPPAAPAAPAPPAAPVPGAGGWTSEAPEVPELDDILPSGWFGFGLSCHGCGGEVAESGQVPRWSFDESPTIYMVEPGSPADRAGLRRGDVLLAIDGVDLRTGDGGRRFGAVRPGQRVRWTYRRGAARHEVQITAGERPPDDASRLRAERDALREDTRRLALEARKLAEQSRSWGEHAEVRRLMEQVAALEAQLAARRSAPPAVRDRSTLRYSGTTGDADVEVRGPDRVMVVDRGGNGLEIRVGDTVVTVRAHAGAAPRDR